MNLYQAIRLLLGHKITYASVEAARDLKTPKLITEIAM
jgi:hypothetical protein